MHVLTPLPDQDGNTLMLSGRIFLDQTHKLRKARRPPPVFYNLLPVEDNHVSVACSAWGQGACYRKGSRFARLV